MTAEETRHRPPSKDLASGSPKKSVLSDVQKTHRLQVRNLANEIENPGRAESLKHQFSNIRMSWYDKVQFDLLRNKLGYRTITETLRYLRQNNETHEPIFPVATPNNVFTDDIPVQLPGPSGSGKTTFAQKLVAGQPGPTLVVDIAAEYLALKRVTLSDIFALKWKRLGSESKFRFIPSTDPEVAKSEIRTVFGFLNRTKVLGHRPGKTPSGALSHWMFVTEEARRVSRELVFLNWLAESRKFVKKNIVIASDPSLFASICRVMRPPPLSQLLTPSESKKE